MTGHSRNVTDEIRRRVGILEVVSPHVTLRRAGRNYKGLCPFHSEKTPSFSVDPERGFFYCFGCHAGGDVFDFLMRMESITFGEARRALAERAGVPLERTPDEAGRAGERERLLRIVAEAASFYRAQLTGEAGAAARRYLASRGVDPETQDTFALGFAPAGWDNLLRALHARGFDAAVAEEAGVAVPRSGGDGRYDALRQRLVFPIRDLQGRPIAFGGRALDDSTPKYLNTRETPLFVKGKTLYALSEAREGIRETGEAIVVEGYMDALACHQFTIRNSVASLGTALTLDQVLLLKRFASRAVLVYDADAAGAEASERGLGLFDQAEMPVRVAILPGTSDPDAFLRAHGADEFRRVVGEAKPVFEYRLARAWKRHDSRTIEGKVGIVDEMSQLISIAVHPVRQAEYVRLLAERLDVREEAIRGQLRRTSRGKENAGPAPVKIGPVSEAVGRAGAEQLLLHLLVANASVREAFRGVVTPEIFKEPGHRALAEVLLGGDPEAADPGRVRERLRDETAISLLSRFLIAEPPAGDPRRMAEGCVRHVRRYALQERIDALLEAHKDADRMSDRARMNALKAELEEVYRELKVSAQAP